MSVPGSLLLTFSAGITDDDGAPLAGGLVYFYTAGLMTPEPVFADALMTTPITQPVELDSAGRATIFVGPIGYDIVVHDANDVLVWDEQDFEDLGQAYLATNGTAVGSKGAVDGYTVVAGDIVVTVDEPTTDPAVITLPSATGWYTELTIKNIGTTEVDVTPDGTDDLDGANVAYTLPAAATTTQPAITLKAHDGIWYIVGSHGVI